MKVSDWNWTTVWHVGLIFVLLFTIPSLLAAAGTPGEVSVAGILLLFMPLLIGAAVTFVPRWKQGDTNAGALGAGGMMTLEALSHAQAQGMLVSFALASAWFIGTAMAGTWLVLRFIRRPS
ncbi:MAG: hypothetical protein A2128_01105 [Candidatus Liptonbacteria bacterium GWC1_60_9]|uniref:Uncharacterized protein n=3 Tax=Candidatus Liptoniibacteriota TaxID=1817909 RepID=A0A1G2CJY1_9BACT|nr:MAG: hypothetical protein UZ00_C0014G0003 [Parcubacteria group bacterium GW2011_GWA1_60_11]OGY96880.1 MAG: hypothetical protein A2128_01105 [Candidatus Liptonbacteria bacterium GWC1_60_9]OGY98306.1 MAG: hypothetical protein A3E09_02590 [Candidatus Liptonbacteria bacterium RIFCSPHIGHO2_12_FULL_60_13]OGZ01659.1 MAG: hypothetical protein A3G64_00105 [Candidatus Liptonbacteria bacterium RIFCSPLOWO2_12_FULL_60_15]